MPSGGRHGSGSGLPRALGGSDAAVRRGSPCSGPVPDCVRLFDRQRRSDQVRRWIDVLALVELDCFRCSSKGPFARTCGRRAGKRTPGTCAALMRSRTVEQKLQPRIAVDRTQCGREPQPTRTQATRQQQEVVAQDAPRLTSASAARFCVCRAEAAWRYRFGRVARQ